MNYAELSNHIRNKRSFLCIGLDTDINRIPKHLLEHDDPIFEFNKAIIDSTKDYCVAYKPNIAFYEAMGSKGWESLEKTLNYIPKDIFTIADAKRGDIGNTSALYARTFFETYNFDSITVAPYMGRDSVEPFLTYKGKWVIVLGLTSNHGSEDFQMLKSQNDKFIFEEVIQKCKSWSDKNKMMFVTGATKAEYLKQIRGIIPDHFLLVPGVGAQGGSLKEVYENASNANIGLLVNSSRGIIYASENKDFAEKAALAAHALQIQMSELMN